MVRCAHVVMCLDTTILFVCLLRRDGQERQAPHTKRCMSPTPAVHIYEDPGSRDAVKSAYDASNGGGGSAQFESRKPLFPVRGRMHAHVELCFRTGAAVHLYSIHSDSHNTLLPRVCKQRGRQSGGCSELHKQAQPPSKQLKSLCPEGLGTARRESKVTGALSTFGSRKHAGVLAWECGARAEVDGIGSGRCGRRPR